MDSLASSDITAEHLAPGFRPRNDSIRLDWIYVLYLFTKTWWLKCCIISPIMINHSISGMGVYLLRVSPFHRQLRQRHRPILWLSIRYTLWYILLEINVMNLYSVHWIFILNNPDYILHPQVLREIMDNNALLIKIFEALPHHAENVLSMSAFIKKVINWSDPLSDLSSTHPVPSILRGNYCELHRCYCSTNWILVYVAFLFILLRQSISPYQLAYFKSSFLLLLSILW